MPHTRYEEESTYSRFKRPLAIRRAQLRGITWLLNLGTAAVFVLASELIS